MEVSLQRDLEEMEATYHAGAKYVLARVIFFCGQNGVPLPGWAAKAWRRALLDVLSSKLASWDEVFGHVPPKSEQKRKSTQIQRQQLFALIELLPSLADVPISREAGGLWDVIAERLSITPRRARYLYYKLAPTTRLPKRRPPSKPQVPRSKRGRHK